MLKAQKFVQDTSLAVWYIV